MAITDMKRLLFAACLALTALLPGTALAQCRDNIFQKLDVNQVRARYQNGGNWHFDMVGSSSYEVPAGSGQHANFAGGLWVGGLDPQQNLHVAASTYRQGGWDWYTGPIRRPQPYGCPATLATSSDIFLNGVKRLQSGKILILTEAEAIVYDPVTRQSLQRPWPTTRTWVEALELPDGRIFLFGDDTYPAKNSALFMDTVSYNLTGGPTLQWFHKESSATLLRSGKVLIAGVVGCEVYDPLTNISTAVPDMLYPRQKHAAAMIADGDVWMVGGGGGLAGTGLTQVTQVFEDSLGYWSPGPPLNFGRQRVRFAEMPDGRFFILGGTLMQQGNEIYDPAIDSLYDGPDLPFAVNEANVVVLDSQWVLIGANNFSAGYSSLFRFNVVTGAFVEIGMQRSGARLAATGQAEVLIQSDDLRQLELVDIVTGEQDDDHWQAVWKVSRSIIDDFRDDFQAGTVDFARYPAIERWPAHGDELLGEERNLAPFIDVNQDGRYRPGLDGDYPCIVGDQALWWVMNDQGEHQESGGRPLGIQVEVMAYAVDCQSTPCPDSSLDYTTFLHLELTNRSDTAYHDLYIGNFNDCDLGNYADDYIACDTALGLAVAFNGDDNDGAYGLHPPAMGMAVLPNGDIDAMGGFMYYNNDFTVTGNPNLPADFYNLLRSRWLNGSHLVNNGLDGYPGTAAGPDIDYIYPSTAEYCGGAPGWSELSSGNIPFDRRYLQVFGPHDLQPGQSLRLDLALVWSRDSTHQASLCRLKANTATIQGWWANVLDHGCFDLVVATEPARPETPALTLYPNPSQGGRVEVAWNAALGAQVVLDVMDLQGRLMSRRAVSGSLEAEVETTGMARGVYLVRVQGEGGMATQRMVLE